ncbi:MAG: hypothetical protein Q8S43_08845 [Actinomycetota bacterium]|nr:hypothetical protein [Actinomycetota bacterium]MDP3631036.1 hypothetical protein [Actinomycetota bacterium]
MKGIEMHALEGNGRSAAIADVRPGQLLAVAAVVAAVLFGFAGLIGAIGYLVSVSRKR